MIRYTVCSLGGCDFVGTMLPSGSFDDLNLYNVVGSRGHNEIFNHRLQSLLCVICGCASNNQRFCSMYFVSVGVLLFCRRVWIYAWPLVGKYRLLSRVTSDGISFVF